QAPIRGLYGLNRSRHGRRFSLFLASRNGGRNRNWRKNDLIRGNLSVFALFVTLLARLCASVPRPLGGKINADGSLALHHHGAIVRVNDIIRAAEKRDCNRLAQRPSAPGTLRSVIFARLKL